VARPGRSTFPTPTRALSAARPAGRWVARRLIPTWTPVFSRLICGSRTVGIDLGDPDNYPAEDVFGTPRSLGLAPDVGGHEKA
jgi:hypothetical protein